MHWFDYFETVIIVVFVVVWCYSVYKLWVNRNNDYEMGDFAYMLIVLIGALLAVGTGLPYILEHGGH